MSKRPGKGSGAVLLPLFLSGLLLWAGCATTRKPSPEPPSEPALPSRVPRTPSPGEPDLLAAERAIGKGELGEASRYLNRVLALGESTPLRGEAAFALALIAARPDNPSRDPRESRRLLREVISLDPPPTRAEAARLILRLLDAEREHERAMAELKSRMALSEADASFLREALKQREDELRRIKEILLGESGGP